MKCTKCKQNIEKTAKFCPHCGYGTKFSQSRKKWIVISALSAALLIALATILVLVLSKPATNTDASASNTDALLTDAKDTVTSFLSAYCAKDGDANRYLTISVANDTPISYEGFQGQCAERMSYRITEVSRINTGDESHTVGVTVEIQNIDLNAVLERLDKKTFDSEEEIIDAFDAAIHSDDVPLKKYTCMVKCKEYPTGLKILLDSELSDALLGGYTSLVTGDVT